MEIVYDRNYVKSYEVLDLNCIAGWLRKPLRRELSRRSG